MDNTNQFLPPDYNVPKTAGAYMKLAQGNNVIRILSNPIMGWLDWDNNKPLRFPMNQKPEAPINPKKAIKHFWAFIIWDYKESKLKVMEITQSTIQESIKNLYEDIDWGSPLNYDIDIKRTGEDMETKYNIIAKPPKAITQEIKEKFVTAKIDLTELYKGGDPFAHQTKSAPQEPQFVDEQQELNEAVDNMPIY